MTGAGDKRNPWKYTFLSPTKISPALATHPPPPDLALLQDRDVLILWNLCSSPELPNVPFAKPWVPLFGKAETELQTPAILCDVERRLVCLVHTAIKLGANPTISFLDLQ